MLKKLSLVAALAFLLVFRSVGKEGMWIPTLLEKYNIEEMKQMGFKLSAEDIYSVNHASMKDAVVLFGTGCTAELISGDGLFITNHHCGYDAIQNHSSLEHDYLTNGFWAKNHQEELTNPGLTARILNRMEDVTSLVLNGSGNKPADSLQAIITRNTKKIAKQAAENDKYEAIVQPLFNGNQYFLYVYEVFADVRLVGAPPSSIGKFGGDTDNWMWPRHTGDFSLFRIYADKENQPAKYSPDNVPYKPKKFFKISLKGLHANDFTMVFGYPGKTQEYLPAIAIKQIMEQGDPDKIAIRDLKLNVLSADMERDREIRIQYSAKYAATSNAWKKWQGEIKGLRRLNAIETKQQFEKDFSTWVNASDDRKKQFGEVLPTLENLYKQLAPYTKANDFYAEIVQRGTDIFSVVSTFEAIESKWNSMPEADQQKIQKGIRQRLSDYFNEYNKRTDEKVFVSLIDYYAKHADPAYLSEDFKSMMKSTSREELAKLYENSVFTNQSALTNLAMNINTKTFKKLNKDRMFVLFKSLKSQYEKNVEPTFNSLQKQIDSTMKTYIAGIMEMKQGHPLWPDANKTLRVAYGKVEGYEPMDGASYDYYTTIDGIIEKDNPNIYDYNIPQALRDLYAKKNYGRYAENGQLHVCFLASNHTTGGNSGSPVLDADGNLIGVNFDRCWEGTMSDLMFDPDRCRNIILDIRYALFVTDKLGGAGYLLNEMQIVE
jgi:Peptidase S46.